MRKPDDVVLSWPWMSFCFGFSIQYYSYNARCITVCIGSLTMHWHRR